MWKKYSAFLFVLLLADQVLKIWIKTHMTIGEEISMIGDWFYIHFLENPGIAFGGKIDHPFWKPALTVFRVGAIVGIAWYINKLFKKGFPKGFYFFIILILAGAVGNVIDSIGYGVLFGDSHYQLATFLPEGGGYAPLLYGKVVDMFYFPLVEFEHMPDWLPILGGKKFIFFSPVFNLADSYITVGIFGLLLFYRKQLKLL
ncbi:MAG: lipoprotein signal peptidase [Flavobacteriaceae bacterium]|nr:lipoprotein signal peptidase [Flavobacteriaceae bacterium]